MTADSRQQRRRLLRQRLKLGSSVMIRGLPAAPGRAEVVAVADVLREKLAQIGNPHRASEAATLAQVLAERSLRNHPSPSPIACAKGCHYCCHGFVGAVPPEAFRIADGLRAGGNAFLDVESVRARTRPLQGLAPAQRIGRKIPCPLLVDGLCSVYAARPLVCRQTSSLSLPDCVREFEGVDPGGRVEISSVHLAHASNAHVALLGAMQAVGLQTTAYELGELLDTVLADASCEARWLAGEPVFAALRNTVKRPPEVDTVATRIAAELGA